ncbi:MAG TPA: PD-(D/E)XK nuclease family protein [Candidatus Paceibacterota bacterium]|nr:PD-(D/E)XK nuclease family protein [Candidatus Paceibacterota bacterium]
MSQYYKPNRKPDYNYGGPKWTLSRSKIDLFLECPRCFYIDNKLGVARPPGYPFNLNSAVDALLKKELDTHRALGTQHPLAKAYGLDAVPLAHAQMDEWRNALSQGVKCVHKETGLTVRGGVDDIWVNPAGELIVIDYKATSKDGRIESLDEEWHRGYKRQIEIYQWLLRQNGFKVSDMGYWFYANASKDRESFDGRLDFELTLVPYKGSTDWIDSALVDLKKCLDSDVLPQAGESCDYCTYREAVGEVTKKYDKPTTKPLF